MVKLPYDRTRMKPVILGSLLFSLAVASAYLVARYASYAAFGMPSTQTRNVCGVLFLFPWSLFKSPKSVQLTLEGLLFLVVGSTLNRTLGLSHLTLVIQLLLFWLDFLRMERVDYHAHLASAQKDVNQANLQV